MPEPGLWEELSLSWYLFSSHSSVRIAEPLESRTSCTTEISQRERIWQWENGGGSKPTAGDRLVAMIHHCLDAPLYQPGCSGSKEGRSWHMETVETEALSPSVNDNSFKNDNFPIKYQTDLIQTK